VHYLVRIISQAPDREAAYKQAVDTADQLVSDGTYDYYVADSEHSIQVGETFRVSSLLGKTAVEEALKWQKAAFMRAMGAIRIMLEQFTDEQMYQNEYPAPADGSEREYWPHRWQFHVAAGDQTSTFLYRDTLLGAGAIQNDTEYQTIVEAHDPQELWVTGFNFHN